MTRCHYSDILQIAATLAGEQYDVEVGASGLPVDTERRLRMSVNAWLAELWARGPWPGLIRVEQRAFRASYSASTAYVAGDFVYWAAEDAYYQAIRSTTGNAPTDGNGTLTDAYWAEAAAEWAAADYASGTAYVAGSIVYYPTNGNFYQCHTASTGNAPTNTSYWGLLAAFERYVAFAQTGETEMDDQAEIHFHSLNPRTTTRAIQVPVRFTEDGAQPVGLCPSRPWVEFKVKCPQLRGEVYVSTDAYAVGDQVQFATASGNVETIDFYDCVATASAGDTPATDPDKWEVVELPDYFKNYLGAKGALGLLTGDSDPRAGAAEAMASAAENALADVLYRVQLQVPQTRQLTYAA